jgi:hypothetical protein
MPHGLLAVLQLLVLFSLAAAPAGACLAEEPALMAPDMVIEPLPLR